MRFLSIDNILPGTRLAKPLYGSKGSVLLRENFELTEAILCRLKALGYNGLYIEDEISEGIVIEDVVDEQLRLEIAFRLEDILINNGNIEEMQPLISQVVDTIIENGDVVINMNRLSGYHKYTFTHSVNVGILAVGIGNKLKLMKKDLIHLGTAGMLHDIGKKYVPLEILDKDGKLTDDEFAVIKTHPERGYEMLSNAYQISNVSKVGVLQHHERFDGSGYPRGLKGTEISTFGRILAVADTYDAMTTDRSYRSACEPSEVFEFLLGDGNQRYDIEIIDNFSKCIAVYPIGTCVELSDGTQGIVLQNYSDCILRPLIRNLENKSIIDLKNDINYLNICITNTIHK